MPSGFLDLDSPLRAMCSPGLPESLQRAALGAFQRRSGHPNQRMDADTARRGTIGTLRAQPACFPVRARREGVRVASVANHRAAIPATPTTMEAGDRVCGSRGPRLPRCAAARGEAPEGVESMVLVSSARVNATAIFASRIFVALRN